MNDTKLSVCVAGSSVRYTGDGKWEWSCSKSGCPGWIIGFSAVETMRLAARHSETHR